jgi:hypothetical protein
VAIIRIGIDPIHLGPLTLAWHGITIALGIVIGGVVAGRWLRHRDLPSDPMYTFGALAGLGRHRRRADLLPLRARPRRPTGPQPDALKSRLHV